MKKINRIFAPLLYSLIFNIWGNNLAMAQNDLPDPIIGTWELNQAESSYSDNAPSMRRGVKRTEIYRILENGKMEMEASTVLPNGRSGSGKVSWDAKGGVALRDGEAAESEKLIESRISPRQWLFTYLENDVQIRTVLKTISEDGNKMIQTTKGFDNQNMLYEIQNVFYKK